MSQVSNGSRFTVGLMGLLVSLIISLSFAVLADKITSEYLITYIWAIVMTITPVVVGFLWFCIAIANIQDDLNKKLSDECIKKAREQIQQSRNQI